MLRELSSTLWPVEGNLFSQSGWEPILSSEEKKLDGKKENHIGLIDTSVLRNEEAPVYTHEPYISLLIKAVISITTTPFYLMGTIGYYLLRIVPISIFIFGAALRERIKKVEKGDRKYHFIDIPKEMGYSLWQIVISPYYALGYLTGLLISIVLPMSGWKMATSFERKWSGDVPKSGAYHIRTREKGNDFKWLSLRHHAYGPQCRHPVATVFYKGGKPDRIETNISNTKLTIIEHVKRKVYLEDKKAPPWLPAGCEP